MPTALFAPNARIAVGWGMPDGDSSRERKGCFLKRAAESEKDYSATNTVINRNQSPSGKAFDEHDSTSEGDRDPCGSLVAGSETDISASPRPEPAVVTAFSPARIPL